MTDDTTTHLYGLDRLASVDGSGTRTWEIHDALGSVRQHLAADGSVVPGGSYAYTPFGVVAGGNTPSPFGFTGELQSEGLVYLRARWYDPSSGAFTARDPFAGFPTRPYSLHPYQYAYADPVRFTDPSGQCILPDGRPCPPLAPEPAPTPHPDATPTPKPYTPPSPQPLTPNVGDGLECVSGFFQQVASNNAFGLADGVLERPGETIAMTVCRRVGDVASIIQGGAAWIGGGAIAAGGVVACGTGVLCFAGAPAIVGGGAIAVHGGGVAMQGTWRLVTGLCTISGGGGGGGNPTPTPTAGPASQSPQPNPGPTKTTPGGRNLSTHADTDSLRRHGFREPFSDVDQIIDNYSRKTTQRDGATVYIKRIGRRGNRYGIVILNEDTNTIVTAIQNLDSHELRQLGRRYGFNSNP